MKFQQQPESTLNPAKVTKPVTQNLPKPKTIEIFREHMIENFYMVLAEETNDTKIYGKLFITCQVATEELFRADRVNELYRDLQGVESSK